MTLDGALRSSILNAIIALRDASTELPDLDLFELSDHLRRGPVISARFDYESALWTLSALSLRLEDVPPDRIECSRYIVHLIVRESKPRWLRFVRSGTNALRDAIPLNVEQCFRDLGLFESNICAATRLWWDKIRVIAYSEMESVQIINGARAEEMCLSREARFLESVNRSDLTPRIVSIFSNSLGYDVSSFFFLDGKAIEKQIEVKGFTGTTPYFHISPNEWRAATTYADSYRLQIWSIDREELVHELTYIELADHIALNRGRGAWSDIIITLGQL